MRLFRNMRSRNAKVARSLRDEAGSLVAQADTMRDARRYLQAAGLYEQSLTLQPENAGIHVQCGHMNKEIGRWALAEAHYRVAQILMPEDADLNLQLGHFYKITGRWVEAAKAYERASQLRTDWAEPRTELAGLGSAGDPDEAGNRGPTPYLEMIAQFRRLMLRLLPSTPVADLQAEQTAQLTAEADRKRDDGKHADAADLYEAALLGEAGQPQLHVQCGHMNKEIGRFALAESHYLAAHAQMPDDPDLNLQLGHFYKITGRLAQSADAYEKAASLMVGQAEPLQEEAAMRERLAKGPVSVAPPPTPSAALLAATLSLSEAQVIKAGLAKVKPRQSTTSDARGRGLDELFDATFYRRRYPEVAQAGRSLLQDYLEEGWRLGRNPNALFDGAFYLATYKDAASVGLCPLVHYILFGQFEGKNPHPLFDTDYYLLAHEDVKEEGYNPLFHFLNHGMKQGRRPHPLFDTAYYKKKYQDFLGPEDNIVDHYIRFGAPRGFKPNPLFASDWYEARMPGQDNPLIDYVLRGNLVGAAPSPLFSAAFYLHSYSDVRDAGIDCLAHYLATGWRERRNPHPLFDTSYYLANNPSLENEGINPLAHYLEEGYRQDKRPSPLFDPVYYRSICPEARPSAVNPLIHYVEHGASRGFEPNQTHWIDSLLDDREGASNTLEALSPAARARMSQVADILDPPGRADEFAPGPGTVPLCAPLNIHAVPPGKSPPRLNILLPVAGMSSTSGGPNTVLNLGYRLAQMGVPLRIISTDGPADLDPRPYLEHARRLAGAPLGTQVDIILADGSDRSRVLYIGQEDQFLASAWWTAQMAKVAVRQTRVKRFFYMIQDYEPLLHDSSSWSALAEETYSLDMIPVINTHLLFDFLTSQGIGRFNDPDFAGRAFVFDPAVDRDQFHYVPSDPSRKRQLLFYARPGTGRRNLFEMGVAVLRKLLADGVLSADEWDFIGMGEAFNAVDLGAGAFLIPAPWLGFADYAQLMRESSILLSLMLSPHPSYPPLEMAACGRLAVTTEFANKTAAALQALSPNIIAAAPTVEALAAALATAVSRLAAVEGTRTDISYHADWEQSLMPVADSMLTHLLAQMGSPMTSSDGTPTAAVGFRHWPADPLTLMKYDHQRARHGCYDDPDASLLSFVTTVWDTAPELFEPLIESVLTQDCQGFEWVVLDNGSTQASTLGILARLAKHPAVRLHRVEENLGIIRGMRYVLERARNRYVLPLDSDDLLTPDTVRIVSTFLRRAGYPALAYTDEDRMIGDECLEPYCKPDWDPVLFFHSCYIAHLCCVDRKVALSLDAYGDANTNGSHDWDTFTRFYIAGHVPAHVPEIVYSWRLHQQSTAANIGSKSYIASSHQTVLRRLIESRPDPEQYQLVPSPLFGSGVDWRFVRDAAPGFTPVRFVLGLAASDEDSVAFPLPIDWPRLAAAALAAEARGAVVHLSVPGLVTDATDDWLREAHTLMGLFPEIGIVGGRLHRDGQIVAADVFFEAVDGSRSPNLHRLVADAGYFAQAWKPHSCDAVPAQHCVVRPDLLAATATRLAGTGATLEGLGLWLGRIAAEQGARVVFSPFFSATLPAGQPTAPSLDERRAQLLIQFRHGGGRTWPPALGRTQATAFRRVSQEATVREAAAFRAVADQVEASGAAALLARRVMAPPIDQLRTISVLTSVWAKTDANLFNATVQSVLDQTMPPAEWVILRNGPVPVAVEAILNRLAADHRINLQSVEANIGIMGAMRFCLGNARCDIVVPMDADDLLAPDALETLLRRFADPSVDMVFTDEDILQDGRTIARIRRQEFDPILNTDDSYVWHLCSFDRAKAVALGVYTANEVEFCHDWDTVSRFATAGCRIQHIPYSLYHWLVHSSSSSNSGELNTRSLRSVRFVLQRTIDRQADPALYEIGPFPMSRGVEQLAILRCPVRPMPVTLVVLATGAFGTPVLQPFLPDDVGTIVVKDAFGTGGLGRLSQALSSVQTDVVCVLAEGCVPEPQGAWEAMRLFELHADVALVGGRLYLADGTVVDACATDPDPARPNSWIGRPITDPGEAALALKPQTARTVPGFYFYGRTAPLQDVAARLDNAASAMAAGPALAEALRGCGERVAYSPLVQARLVADPRAIVDPMGLSYPRRPGVRLAAVAGSAPSTATPGTILWPHDWEHVGPLPLLKVASDFMGRLSVRIAPLAEHKAKQCNGVPLKLHRKSYVSQVLTATPIEPLAFGRYVAEVLDRDGKAISAVGFIVGPDQETREAALRRIVRWRDPAIPKAPQDTEGTAPLFSVTTTAYDTPISFLEELAGNILSQTWTSFEWLVLDNGSRDPRIIRFLAGLAERDKRIRTFRVDDNIHIIPGNRYLLEHAAGYCIVPVDSDDIVYADALERLARYRACHRNPEILYSEEVKVDAAGRPKSLLWRAEHSNLFALCTCPASHLMAFDRELALKVGVYMESYARGSHDWDTYLRLVDAGARPVRVPEVLYGWRMHAASSAMSSGAKDYLTSSQREVLEHSLVRRGLKEFSVAHATGHEIGYYHLLRSFSGLPAIRLAIVVRPGDSGTPQQIADIVEHVGYDPVQVEIHLPVSNPHSKALHKAYPGAVHGYKDLMDVARQVLRTRGKEECAFLIDSRLRPDNPSWLRDAMATFELDPLTGIVGGMIAGEDGATLHCGYVAGLDGFLESPHLGSYGNPPWNAIRRTVMATYGGLIGVRRETVKKIGGLEGIDGDEGFFGVEFSLRARRAGIMTAFCPTFSAVRSSPLSRLSESSQDIQMRIAKKYADLIASDPYYTAHLPQRADFYEVQS